MVEVFTTSFAILNDLSAGYVRLRPIFDFLPIFSVVYVNKIEPVLLGIENSILRTYQSIIWPSSRQVSSRGNSNSINTATGEPLLNRSEVASCLEAYECSLSLSLVSVRTVSTKTRDW